MLQKIRVILNRTNNIKRSSYTWNAVNAIVSAMQSPIILMVMARTNGIYDAGVFSIAFAVANLMLYIGLYGLRRFQSSDINEKYSYGEYHGMRIISTLAMFLASVAYGLYGVWFNSYNGEKFFVVLLCCFVKCCQAYSDVYHGRMQQKGRLDVATKSSSIRYALELIIYCIALVITRNLIVSTIAFAAASIVGLFITTVNAGRDFGKYKPDFNGKKIKGLAFEGFPLFASLFLNAYISNAPKYAIDAYLTEEIQAIYNMIFMPAFVVMIMANFIFNPILTTYAELWLAETRREYKQLKKNIIRQIFVIAGLTVAGLLISFFLGCPILSLVFGVDLSDYKLALCIVMLGGGALAYSTFFSTILTIMRKQNLLLVCYLIVSIGAKLLSGVMVTHFGVVGAAALYGILMLVLTFALGLIIVSTMRKKWRIVRD